MLLQNRCRLIALALLLSLAAPLTACLWDYDTLAMEAQRFPNTLELITGHFVRHSDEYYRWRVENRTKRREEKPEDVRLIDDLAVAHDKLREHDLAIELMRELLAKDANRYETHANLGTFLIHSGDLAAGLEHIEKAIEINPNAHFGREIYQAQLVRYVLQRRAEMNGEPALPLRVADPNKVIELAFAPVGFAAFLEQEAKAAPKPQAVDRKGAIKGVLGMMRFGKYDSPVLLEALGDLLSMPNSDDAKRMATRAYLKASYETEGDVSKKYREFADAALNMQVVGRGNTSQVKLETIENELKAELEQGRKFAASIQADEKAWIHDGLDVDAQFTTKYYETKTARLNKTLTTSQFGGRVAVLAAILAVAAVIMFCGAFALWRLSARPVDPLKKPLK